MYGDNFNREDISVKTNYSQRRKRNKLFKNENNFPQSYTVGKDNRYKERKDKYILKDDKWSNMMARTSKEGQNAPISNSKSYQSNIFHRDNYNNMEKRHFKESDNYDYATKTQITTLPGGVKRNKYEIKDDYIFKKPYNYSQLYKQVYDFNSNIDYERNYDPITQGYNVNSFPTKERYYGSYRRGVHDHDIFNTKFYNSHKYLYDF